MTNITIDTGGTFTDCIVGATGRSPLLVKAPTTPHDPVEGVFDALTAAADARSVPLAELLGECGQLVFGTTRAVNAVITGTTAPTALVCTKGHRDVLLFAEGGRPGYFSERLEYPTPFVPRARTHEVDERVGADGTVVRTLSDAAIDDLLRSIAGERPEAVAVALLWSIANPTHELAVADALGSEFPDLPITLSHQVNPIIREYRRTCSASLDASLKPVMQPHLLELEARLRTAGFAGTLLVATSNGGLRDAATVAATPIHSLNSGPSLAPVAARAGHYHDGHGLLVIADTGGTTFDLSFVHGDRIPRTNEAWIGTPRLGIQTGLPALDVKSVGAGGGSIAWVDDGGLLRVGPQSAGAEPGPACYGRGGLAPTLTDACVVLGIIDPQRFLGGSLHLDLDAAATAIRRDIAESLGVEVIDAASSIYELATRHMVEAVEEHLLLHGLDQRDATLVMGGGAGGLNAAALGRQLGCRRLVVPSYAAALSAAGGLVTAREDEFVEPVRATSARPDDGALTEVLQRLRRRAESFFEANAIPVDAQRSVVTIDARYESQAWDLEVELDVDSDRTFSVQHAKSRFDATHQRIFGVIDPDCPIEIYALRCRVAGPEHRAALHTATDEPATATPSANASRSVHFPGHGTIDATIVDLHGGWSGHVDGPAILETDTTTITVEPGMAASALAGGDIEIYLGAAR